MNANCRIGRVRPKASNVAIFSGDPQLHHLGRRLMRHARIVADQPGLGGFAVVGWGKDGWRMEGWAVDPKGPITDTMVPGIVHDILFRRICDPREPS